MAIKLEKGRMRDLINNGLSTPIEGRKWMTRTQAKALVRKMRFYNQQPLDIYPTMLPPCFLYVQWPFIFMAILPDGSCHT